MKYIPILSILLLAGCSTGNNGLAGLKRELLGKNFDSLPVYRGYFARDTILEGDEGIRWKAKAYYSDSALVFLAEASWEDARKVHRITILGPQIKGGRLFVDQRFRDIRELVLDKIPSSPDGYLFLTYKKDTAISIQLDIAGEASGSPLFDGVSELGKIPDTLRVASIVIL